MSLELLTELSVSPSSFVSLAGNRVVPQQRRPGVSEGRDLSRSSIDSPITLPSPTTHFPGADAEMCPIGHQVETPGMTRDDGSKPPATLVRPSVGPSIHSQRLIRAISSHLTHCVIHSGCVFRGRPLSGSRRRAARCAQPRVRLKSGTGGASWKTWSMKRSLRHPRRGSARRGRRSPPAGSAPAHAS
jgi:hypothetical protein